MLSRLAAGSVIVGLAVLGPVSVRTQSAPTQSQPPVFRAGSLAVSRDVIVRDASGGFVRGLSRADFRITEDGVPQTIEWFSLVQGGQVIDDAPAPPRRVVEGLMMPATAPPKPPARIWIVLIDDLHLQALDTPRVRRVIRQIADEVIRDEDLVAVVSTGYSSIESSLAYDLGGARLRAAADKVMGSGMTPAQIISTPSGATGVGETKYLAHVAFATAHRLLEQARAIPNRRKAIVYVSNSYDFDPLAESRLAAEQERWSIPGRDGQDGRSLVNPFDRQGREFSDAELVADVAELIRAADRANVAFHTVDPRGLDAGPPIDVHVSPVEWRRMHQKQVTSLRVLAEQTGGVAVVDTNDIVGGLRRIADDMSDYYVLGYTSGNGDRSRRTRRVTITVPGRSGLTLKYDGQYALAAR